MQDTKPLLRLRRICKSFRIGILTTDVLRGIDFEVQSGEMTAIIGSSGGGKSTLMNIIGLLDEPTSGTYEFEGQDVLSMGDWAQSAIRNRKMGFVFQQFHLLPKLSALENVALPLMYRGFSARSVREDCCRMLDKVGMGDRYDHKPTELSGGQQQRVAIARSLVGSPSILLADEPTGALDSKVGQEIIDLFKKLNGEEKITILMVTHDSKVAGQCRRVVRVNDGQLVTAS